MLVCQVGAGNELSSDEAKSFDRCVRSIELVEKIGDSDRRLSSQFSDDLRAKNRFPGTRRSMAPENRGGFHSLFPAYIVIVIHEPRTGPTKMGS